MAVETLEDLMNAITSIVTIGMSGDPRTTVRHLSFTRFWADRLAALADRQPNGVPLGILLRIDAREVARDQPPSEPQARSRRRPLCFAFGVRHRAEG
jgi:hypothetical protein